MTKTLSGALLELSQEAAGIAREGPVPLAEALLQAERTSGIVDRLSGAVSAGRLDITDWYSLTAEHLKGVAVAGAMLAGVEGGDGVDLRAVSLLLYPPLVALGRLREELKSASLPPALLSARVRLLVQAATRATWLAGPPRTFLKADGDPAYARRLQVQEAIEPILKKYQKRVAYYVSRNTSVPHFSRLFNELQAELKPLLAEIVQHRGEEIVEAAGITLDAAVISAEALEWVNSYSFELITKLTETTKKVVERALQTYIQTPGMTRAQVEGLIAPAFTPYRASMIAVTETTRAYSEATNTAKKVLEKEGLQSRRVWDTLYDELVCPFCGPLNGITEDLWEETLLAVGIVADPLILQNGPPAHVNCRCGTSLRVQGAKPEDIPGGWPGMRRGKKEPAPAPSPPAPPPPVQIGPYFPPDISGLEVVRNLGGSTGAQLVRDPVSGELYVMKRGGNVGHIREECLADQLYQALGANVPEFKLYETPSGPVKLATYIPDTKDLGSFLRTASPEAKAAALKQIQDGFVADCLLANWDVAGMSFDNILIDKDGKLWRIDNGGSLRYRAQGAKKDPGSLDKWVTELWSLRDPSRPISELYSGIDFWEIVRQAETASSRGGALQAILDRSSVEGKVALSDLLGARMGTLRDFVIKTGNEFKGDNWKATYTDTFVKHLIGLEREGIFSSVPEKFYNEGNRLKTSAYGRIWNDLRGPSSISYRLDSYMKKNGGEYNVMNYWMSAQAGSSWSNAAQILKAWSVENWDGDYSSHYWQGGSEGHALERLAAARGKIGREKFDASYTMWHAFNYGFLRRTEFPGNDIANAILRVGRTESAGTKSRYNLVKGRTSVYLRGAAESSSIFHTTCYQGNTLMLTEVPHHRVFGLYFFERTPGSNDGCFCGDGENEAVVMLRGLTSYCAGTVSSGSPMSSYWALWGR